MRHCTQEKCNVVGAMGISGMGGVEHETLSVSSKLNKNG